MGTQTQDSNKLPIGVWCQSRYHKSIVNCQGMCQSQEGQNRHQGEGKATAPTKTRRPPSRVTESNVSGILKRGRQGHATLCLSLNTSGTDCRDYKSELSDRVLESARMNSGEIQGTRRFLCPYSTTQWDILGWDTHKTINQKKHKERS